jgi:hypothetical protein
MLNSSKDILINEYKANSENWRAIADSLNIIGQEKSDSRVIYFALDFSAVIEIKAIKSFSEISSILNDSKKSTDLIKDGLMCDIRRQILTLVEVIKDQDQLVPNTDYLQLRHIEVPLSVYDEYLIWRQRTIFSHVKKQSTIQSFVAYHSLISTEPGVMFLSGFNGNINDYQAGFDSKEYKEIVKEAGTKYIAGGERGLYTTLYQRY